GTWAAAGAVTTALGPPLGGWLVDTIGWRAIFFINLPVALGAFLLTLRIEPDKPAKQNQSLDMRGAAYAGIGLGLLAYGLIALGAGQQIGGILAIAIAMPALWLFIRTERISQAPMLPLSLFGNAEFAGANTLTVLLYASLSGALFLLPFLLIR